MVHKIRTHYAEIVEHLFFIWCNRIKIDGLTCRARSSTSVHVAIKLVKTEIGEYIQNVSSGNTAHMHGMSHDFVPYKYLKIS